MRSAAILVLLASSITMADAALANVSLRGGYERYDDRYTLDVDSPLGDDSSHHRWDDNNAYFAGFSASIPIVRIGLFAFYRERDDAVGGVGLDYDSFGARAEAGLSMPLVPKLLHVELSPYYSLGQARLKYDTPLGDDTETDTFTEYGIHGDLVLTLTKFEAGVGLGYGWGRASFSENIAGTDVDVEIREHVPMIRIFAGLKF
jgi:hypothetical protein